MATTIERTAVARSGRPQRDVAPDARPVIVATDASAVSDAALRAAQAIALHTLRPVRVVAVYTPPPLVVTEVAVIESPDMDVARRAQLEKSVREQLARTGIIYDWPIEVSRGDPAATIARVAEESDASLIIMGLGKHGLMDRLLGEETVLRVLRLGRTPVLAVTPDFSRLPLRVLAATDFSASSAGALKLAGELAHPFGTVTLAHVTPDDGDARSSAFTDNGRMYDIHYAFDRVVSASALPRSLNVVRKVWPGEPGSVLVDACKRIEPDLVVVGSHGHGFVSRLLLGSVSQRLVRAAQTSVLVAPPVNGPSYLEELIPSPNRFTRYEWAERLEEFTRRNASRPATMEIIDPELGAQVEERGFPFVGASYDPRNGNVHIMLASGTDATRHLTRTMRNVTALQMLRDGAGRDLVLRVAQGRAQTLLTFER
jgi:nucleotide-binding universal stress UspA family protein